MDGLRIVTMVLPLASALMPSCGSQFQIRRSSQRVKGSAVLSVHFTSDIVQGNSADSAHGSREISVYNLPGYPDCLEDLTALVGLDGRDPHLGCDLYYAKQDSSVIICYRSIVILVQLFLFHQLGDGCMGQIGINCRSTITQQGRKVMNLPGLARFQDQGHGSALSGFHQMFVDRGNRQKRGDGHMVFIHTPVRQDQNICPFPVGLVHLHKEVVQDPFHRG